MDAPQLVADAWLSKQLGKAAFHLSGKPDRIADHLGSLSARLSQGVAFADAKVPTEKMAAVAALQSVGFRLIDTNLQFDMRREDISAKDNADIAFATPADAGAIGDIAEHAFVYDRFHCDPEIPDAVAGALKRAWVQNFFAGERGDWMVIARRHGAVAGFLQLLKRANGGLVIDLIAVDVPHRGTGLARAMIGFAVQACEGADPLVVGTQVRNIPSVRLYESIGFRLITAQYVFHRHGAATC